jgi:hypothetical protein
MKNKGRPHSAEFKARVALEAIKGIKTVQEIAADNRRRKYFSVKVTGDFSEGVRLCGFGFLC